MRFCSMDHRDRQLSRSFLATLWLDYGFQKLRKRNDKASSAAHVELRAGCPLLGLREDPFYVVARDCESDTDTSG